MSICNHQKDKSIIISASNDQTIRFWNVDTFFSILTYKLQFIFRDMSIVNECYFYGHYDCYTGFGMINSKLQFMYAHDSEIVNLEKSIENIDG